MSISNELSDKMAAVESFYAPQSPAGGVNRSRCGEAEEREGRKSGTMSRRGESDSGCALDAYDSECNREADL
jgi:hypothetical protein